MTRPSRVPRWWRWLVKRLRKLWIGNARGWDGYDPRMARTLDDFRATRWRSTPTTRKE